LLQQATAVAGVADLREVGPGGGLETPEALRFLCELYLELKAPLARVLERREKDRRFMDERARACFEFNRDMGRDFLDPDYFTILGLEDADGRVVIGAKPYDAKKARPVAPLPDFLKGPHVTLFGPPDTAKMAINAMNAFHRRLPGEPAVVSELVGEFAPMWGADDEDSKTPLRADLVEAGVNLTACFEGRLTLDEGGKRYELSRDHLALPIKRFPGLALPSSFLFLGDNPIPLHLYDFALHLFRNWENPRALTFYVPKLENEEEAAYIHAMVGAAERRLRRLHPEYREGSVRLMIVLENPRAILRTHEIMDALHPYFAGASLGWHDYLASTARVFKEDGNYRIPVKADPEIVIKYIRASHLVLADIVGSRGGIKVGGMYGVLPLTGNARSLQITMKGFFKDVVTQMKRDLTGFWVAHPDFVRLGLALVEAWRRREAGDGGPLEKLVDGLLEGEHRAEVRAFIAAPDHAGLDAGSPGYVRSLIVADIKQSDYIANNHPDEIRYNVFQSLQYLADWLSGNGCVALPTVIEGVPVRVMDDLATTERSRWEVWHELRHGRFALEDFLVIAHEELNCIRRDLSDGKKIVQVKWDERTDKWYPVAFRIMLKLMTDARPVEFASELLMPFTVESVRAQESPLASLAAIDPRALELDRYVEDFRRYFEVCGSRRFAESMARRTVEDLDFARGLMMEFSLAEVKEAAAFHGNIGDSKKVLDERAASEQAGVIESAESARQELIELGERYLAKFGVKFLISAKDKSSGEILRELARRLELSPQEELANSRRELWEISRKRLAASPPVLTRERLEHLRLKHGVIGASIAVHRRGRIQAIPLGESVKGSEPVTAETRFEIASLSKTVGAAFALEYFRKNGIPLGTPVNALFAKTKSTFRLQGEWAGEVTLEHLLSHTALNMHYVNGFAFGMALPPSGELIDGKHGYEGIRVVNFPGTRFSYSGAGFLVLEHLIESLEGRDIRRLTRPFLDRLGVKRMDFDAASADCAHGYRDSGEPIKGSRFNFPAFAAGGFASSTDMSGFLSHLARAYARVEGSAGISHDTAVLMLHGRDRGARDFMGCDAGLGVFTAEAGPNRIALHQGANDGFRALYLECYDGPDRGEGLVILCNGDNSGVSFIAEAAQEILRTLGWRGVDQEKFRTKFKTEGLAQEQIVNIGYKDLLLTAFQPDLPERIDSGGAADPLAPYNLAARARIVRVSNQKFARAENLISSRAPVFDPTLFGRQGKVMDSWESARHNPDGHDTLVLALDRPARVHYVGISTKFHDGNQAEFIRLAGLDESGRWIEFLRKTPLAGHAKLELEIEPAGPFSEIRVEMYPDGGLTRLGLYEDLPAESAGRFRRGAECIRYDDPIPKTKKPLTLPYRPDPGEVKRNLEGAPRADWAGAAFGGRVLHASNEHFGPAVQVISPFQPLHMFDGLESARSRTPGHFDEVVIQLGRKLKDACVELDFEFFVNNNPLLISLDGRSGGSEWHELSGKTKVKAYAANRKTFDVRAPMEFDQLRVRCHPDGGINRIRVFSPDSAE
jgi:allantoicase/malate synthase/CubicO group peptidase (beta-lactamase class C family)/2-oxo-4-hydroxy-4-carboxy--5-ureidoimidazoline (OHCU) decarboxylase